MHRRDRDRRITVTGDSVKILVVDDADLARETLVRILKRASHDVRGAANAAEMWAALDEDRPDCILLDRRLPDGDGTALLLTLRSDPRTQAARIVILSGDPLDPATLQQADAVLLKPAGVREILAAVG